MFPNLNLDNTIEKVTEQEKEKQGKTFLYDFENGDFVIQDGRLVEVDGITAIQVWIEKVLRTEKFKFKVYEADEEDADEYGTTIKRLIQGRKVPQFFLQSEVKREVEEALQKHVEVDRVENFKTEQELTTLRIFFRVILKDDNSFEQEVNF